MGLICDGKTTYDQIPIFVISLERAKERRAFIERQMESYRLEFVFFDAVDGARLNEEQKLLVDPFWKKKRHGDPLRVSELGCSMSHALVYKKIIDMGFCDAIVLEDDAHLTERFVEIARRRVLMPQFSRLVIFHAYKNQYARKGSSRPISKNLSLYESYGRFLGTCGYYISVDAARVLYKAAIPVWTQADWPLDISSVLSARGIEPPVIEHDDGFESQVQVFKSRRIPVFVKLMRLLIVPTLLFPSKFGTAWKAFYIWQAAFFRLKTFFFAKPVALLNNHLDE